jgi:outer membrane receptor protein involved in Fe transport
VNITYNFTEKSLLRLAYGKTLNRPEFRELAPFSFYDFVNNRTVSGNPDLKNSDINNFDFRYEFYPSPSELISIAAFYKDFTNPIEIITRPDVDKESTYKNVSKAINYGVELEFRTIIGSLINSDSSSLFNNLSLYSNLAIIRSVVDVSSLVGSAYKTRPLQGQSPYVFNAGLTYFDENLDMSFSANINRVGDRIAILGTILEPDIWEKSRTFIDFQIAKSFFNKRLDAKVNFQNILSQDQVFYQNNYFDNESVGAIKGGVNSILIGDKRDRNGYDEKIDDLIWSTTFGKTISASIIFKF